MANLSRRVAKIEETANPTKVVVLFKNPYESTEAARLRWEAENPGRKISDRDLQVFIVKWASTDDAG